MEAEMVSIKSNSGARCRLCPEDKKLKKGDRALKITAKTAKSPYLGDKSFYCVSHARAIQMMFTNLDV